MLIDLSDILLGAGALGAALYCLVLSRRLRRFTDLEGGVGGAVAVLSAQVDDLTRMLARAESAAKGSVATLSDSSARAEAAGRRLELLMASLHDLPLGAEPQAPRGPVFVRHASAPSEDLPPAADDPRAAVIRAAPSTPGASPSGDSRPESAPSCAAQADDARPDDPRSDAFWANDPWADDPWADDPWADAIVPTASPLPGRGPRSFLDQFVSPAPARSRSAAPDHRVPA